MASSVTGSDRRWERLILDAAPPVASLGSLAVGDLDGDGRQEIVTGGTGGLLWYRPATFERGVIGEGDYHVGLALEDLDGDGLLEVVAGRQEPGSSTWTICWFKQGADLGQPWACHVIDPACSGGAHDLVFCDVDGDGERELLANAAYCEVPGVFIYEPERSVKGRWRKHAVVTGAFSEGLAAADLDGDGRVEIVHGPDVYFSPVDGPFAGPWRREVYAPAFREMCRTALVDVTGNGRDDVVVVESEYVDGRMSWFENRLGMAAEDRWVEHRMDEVLVFAHSLDVRRDGSGRVRVFVAEMAAGGWHQPYNWNARLVEYTTGDGGKSWRREVLDQGAGTHQAVMRDVDGDATLEIVGKEWGAERTPPLPRVHLWKQREGPPSLPRFRHRLLDRDKPYPAVDVLAADVDGDGLLDLVCGAWWYRNPTWERRQVPGVYQVHCAFDLDGDGRQELIATREAPDAANWYAGLSSELCWLKPLDPVGGSWEEHPIGRGTGDWPHGTLVAPVLPGGRPALVVAYHSAHAVEGSGHYPELFEVPDDPTVHPWPRRVLAEVAYGEEIVAWDLNGNGSLDLVGGCYWFENLGDGTFHPHQLADVPAVARVRVADVNGNGRPDVVYVVEAVDYQVRRAAFAAIAWLENPGDPHDLPWPVHVVDRVRSPHSLDVADLDGDGEPELVVGEHDPFAPYRSRSRLLIYKKAEPGGRAWVQHVVDDRFEHHDGARVFEVAPGRLGIASHGWADSRYVHLWEVASDE